MGGVASDSCKAMSDKGNAGERGKIIRMKERTVGEIVEKVMVWRKLYNGIIMPNPADSSKKQLQRWSLDDAAHMVGVSKKSLDDYMQQLRFGKLHGFNFVKHKDARVGELRKFVKVKKAELK